MPTKESIAILRAARKEKPCPALDMGCRSGYIGKGLLERKFPVDFLDIERSYTKKIREEVPEKNSGVYCSDLFNSIPKKKYGIMCFDIPFFPEKSDAAKSALGRIITALNVEGVLLPLLIYAFPKKAEERRKFIERFFSAALPYLKKGGKIFIALFRSEIPLAEKEYKIISKHEIYKNCFLLSILKKGSC